MTISSDEPELRTLMLAGLDGDEASHKSLLTKLSAYLRAYFKGQLARIGRGPADAEDLVQETLIALHTRRHTYDPNSGSWSRIASPYGASVRLLRAGSGRL